MIPRGYEETIYAVPETLCECGDAQELYLKSPAIRENSVSLHDGVMYMGMTDSYDDGGAGESTLCCANCDKEWPLTNKHHVPVKSEPEDELCDPCNDTGILIMNDTEIQKCDDCNKYATDEDAADAVRKILYPPEVC